MALSKNDIQSIVNAFVSVQSPRPSHEHMLEICGINLHLGNNELEKVKNIDSFSSTGPWLPTE